MKEHAPTDITGWSFLSYRRARSHEARLLIEAQHDVGIPTWQDIRNLENDHTEEAIRGVLEDPLTANALLWLTPEVEGSPMIQRVEAPRIVKRHERKNGFFCVPVAAGGLDYDEAAATVGQHLGTADLQEWNIQKVVANPIGPEDAAGVARRVLRRRLAAIESTLPKEAPLRLTLDTRVTPAFQAGNDLTIDWSHRFDGREAPSQTWDEYLLPALTTVASSLEEKAPNRRIEARGRLSIPAATALGATFLAPRQLQLDWWQYMPGKPNELWSLDARREDSGFVAETRSARSCAEDLAVLVSVAEDVEPAFGATRNQLPPFRAITEVTRNYGNPPHTVTGPGQAVDAAHVVSQAIRQARRDLQIRGNVHLFMAIPVGLAVLIGQLLNTLGPVQTYEHIPDDAVGRYRPAALLRPAA